MVRSGGERGLPRCIGPVDELLDERRELDRKLTGSCAAPPPSLTVSVGICERLPGSLLCMSQVWRMAATSRELVCTIRPCRWVAVRCSPGTPLFGYSAPGVWARSRHDALKVLPADVSADPEFRDRFNREADLAAALFHIVGVHDRGEFQGQLWIAMDYVEGTDAGQLMKARYPDGMSEHDVCAIVTAVAGALDYAKQRRLLHRDVKPANILLTEPEDGERRVLLADSG